MAASYPCACCIALEFGSVDIGFSSIHMMAIRHVNHLRLGCLREDAKRLMVLVSFRSHTYGWRDSR